MNPGLVIYGNGAMARVLYSYIRCERDVVAFTVDDDCIAPDQRDFCGFPLVPFSRVQEVATPEAHEMIVAVGYREMNRLRQTKQEAAVAKGYSLASYIHASVIVHQYVEIGANCIILDHVSIHPGTSIGKGSFVSSNVNIGHDCNIGNYCWVNSGVAIAGGVNVGERSFFGVNASVVDNISIGAANFVAANTLMAKSSDDGEVYLSSPGERFRLGSEAFLRFSES